ncbi:MAG: 30S ribosomal protein S2 [bacterium]|nr:30S ribosomal protein S2 [bacterium]
MPKQDQKLNIDPEEMLKAGCHFGHRTSVSHPKMKQFLFGTRNDVQIIDVEKSAEKLKEALSFVQELIKEGKIILLVGTKIQMKKIVAETAKEAGLPYVAERWLGGTFTNFEVIKKRVSYMKDLQQKKAEGLLEKYTKKEIAKFEKEIRGLEERLGGIKDLEAIPEAIFACDMKKDLAAIREAKIKKVRIIGISDTNTDPTLADYPIPVNDDAVSSVRYVLGKLKEAVLKAKS